MIVKFINDSDEDIFITDNKKRNLRLIIPSNVEENIVIYGGVSFRILTKKEKANFIKRKANEKI